MDSPNDRAVRRGALAIALTLTLIVITTATAIVFPSGREWVRQRMRWAPAAFTVGAASDLPAGLYDDADFSVLMFATNNCAACQRALPFHQELVRAASNESQWRARLLMTSPGDDTAAYAATMALPADRVTRFDATGTKLRHVPTVLIVDRHGTVRAMTEGLLADAEQRAMLEKIRTLK